MNSDHPRIVATLTEYITGEIAIDREPAALGPEDDLLEESLVDSLGIMRLVAFIRETYGYSVPAADVTIENFATVRAIADYLAPKVAARPDHE